MTEIIKNFAIGGYRSFGSVQYFPSFKKINLFIGRNNSGKSNILRYINNFHAPNPRKKHVFKTIDRHQPNGGSFISGLLCETDYHLITQRFLSQNNIHEQKQLSETIRKIYDLVAQNNEQNLCWTLFKYPQNLPINDAWENAIKKLNNNELAILWQSLTNHHNGDRVRHWEPQVIQILQKKTHNRNRITLYPCNKTNIANR